MKKSLWPERKPKREPRKPAPAYALVRIATQETYYASNNWQYLEMLRGIMDKNGTPGEIMPYAMRPENHNHDNFDVVGYDLKYKKQRRKYARRQDRDEA